MGRIIAIDYGSKRTGIAVTDELKISANPIGTFHSAEVIPFLKEYLAKEKVDTIVVGEPKQMDNTNSPSAQFIEPFIKNLKKVFPEMTIERYDERFTSVMAFQTMIDAGLKKKDRRNKALIDTISAVIILQSYMESIKQRRNY